MHGIICCKFMHCSPWRCYSFLYGMYCVLGTTLCEGNWKCRYCPRRITCSQGRVVKHCLTTLPESHAHKGRLSIPLSCQCTHAGSTRLRLCQRRYTQSFPGHSSRSFPHFGAKTTQVQRNLFHSILNLSKGIHREFPFWVGTIMTFEANQSIGTAIFIEEAVRGPDRILLPQIGKEHSVQFVRV